MTCTKRFIAFIAFVAFVAFVAMAMLLPIVGAMVLAQPVGATPDHVLFSASGVDTNSVEMGSFSAPKTGERISVHWSVGQTVAGYAQDGGPLDFSTADIFEWKLYNAFKPPFADDAVTVAHGVWHLKAHGRVYIGIAMGGGGNYYETGTDVGVTWSLQITSP